MEEGLEIKGYGQYYSIISQALEIKVTSCAICSSTEALRYSDPSLVGTTVLNSVSANGILMTYIIHII